MSKVHIDFKTVGYCLMLCKFTTVIKGDGVNVILLGLKHINNGLCHDLKPLIIDAINKVESAFSFCQCG